MKLLSAVIALTFVTTLCAVAEGRRLFRLYLHRPSFTQRPPKVKEFPKVEEPPEEESLFSYRSDDNSQSKAFATQKDIKYVIGKLESFKHEIDNELTKINKDVKELTRMQSQLRYSQKATQKDDKDVIGKLEKVNKVLTHDSCKQIQMSQSNRGSGVYQISVGNNQVTSVYCQMSSVSGCSGGGWTMVMKIDGSQSTFTYNSSYWTSKGSYNDNNYGRNGGLDNRQFKGSTYWRTSFKEICVGMKYGGRLKAFSFSYPASSLYDVIADGNYRQTCIGRSQWKQLIYGSSLQRHCNREGFNVYIKSASIRVRLGLVANEQNNCNTPDSFIGLGADGALKYPWTWCHFSTSLITAGNLGHCTSDNGNKNAKAMGYILVR